MAADTFTEVTTQGWFGRIGDSIKGVLVGLVLVVVGAGVLFWNEGRAVKTAKDLAAGAKNVISIPSDAVVSANESKLVHLTAAASTTQHLEDKQFAVSPKENVLKLRRQVQMYQWKETEKKEKEKNLGGGETTRTTYTYSKTWSDKLIDSRSFKQPADHVNPQSMKFNSRDQVADPINAGTFVLESVLTAKMNNFEPFPVTQPDVSPAGPERPASESTPALPPNLKVSEGGYYLGNDPSSPQIGDTKIGFSVVKPGPVSAIGKQLGNHIGSFIGDNGTDLAMLQTGTVSAADMFKAAEAANRMMTWILRLVGFLAIWFGLMAILKPLTVMADILPFMGDLLGMGLAIGTFFVGGAMSITVIGIGWLVYRPVLGVGLLVVAVGLMVWLKKTGKSHRLAANPAMA